MKGLFTRREGVVLPRWLIHLLCKIGIHACDVVTYAPPRYKPK